VPNDPTLLNPDRLFQQLLIALDLTGVADGSIAADLDIDSFDRVPFITHNTTIAADRNGPGLWTAALTITAHIEAGIAHFPIIQELYAGIWSWDGPDDGIVPGVGAVERVENEIQAFTRLGRGVPMLNKVVTPYVGSFELSIRNI
jgi:hypothetical protein